MARKNINNKSKVVVFDFPGHPFVHQLTRELSNEDKFEIYHLYNPKQLGPKSNFLINENEIVIEVSKSFSRNFYKRFFDEIIYCFISIYKIIRIKPDVMITSSMPLIPLFFISLMKYILNFKFIFWVQDIISLATSKILARKNNPLSKIISSLFEWMEFSIVGRSDSIIFITEDFKKKFKDVIEGKNIYTIPNWGSTDSIKPEDKVNDFSLQFSLSETFNIMYSGTLGYKHNPDVLLGLSKFLIENNIQAKLIIVSEGPVVEFLIDKSSELNLNNFVFLPFQKYSIFSQVLGSSDINLILLENDSSDFCVPSKFLSTLCAKRIPIVNVSKENLVSKIIYENNCGFHVKNQNELNETIKEIYFNKDKYSYVAKNGYDYAMQNFNIKKISSKFINIIKS